ncbi:hypothetical protein IFR05_014673 [Cadophora sp. M221]|nr:hypothetical protein IFR05_014673 [Cadophora sp. M221]
MAPGFGEKRYPPNHSTGSYIMAKNNILISDSSDITGIIDWQHATILPIFLQAKIPKHFQNYGDDDSENFRRPELAEDFANMTSSDKEVEMERYRRRQLHYFYLGYTSDRNKAHFHAMETEWSEIAPPEDSCPVRYSSAEIEECLDRNAKQNNVNEQMQQARDFVGVNIDGLVLNEDFESARARAKLIKNELAEGADTDEERREFDNIWPFQDHEELG